MTAPVTVSAVESAATVKTVAASIIAKAGPEEDADPNWRKEKHGAWRWWRHVIITRRRSAVRLNHICAGVRAYSSKHECGHSQCHHETFFSHN